MHPFLRESDMNLNAKNNQKIREQLGRLRRANGSGICWVCGSISGVKTAREGYGTRCRKCIEAERVTSDVVEYARLKSLIGDS